jgi:hypothetical protein
MAQLTGLVSETFYDSTLTDEQRKPVRICSVYPAQAHIIHNGRTVSVPACEDGKTVAMSPPVGPGVERRDFGNAQQVVIECISSRDNALDAIGLTRGRTNARGEKIQERSTSEYFEMGFFVPAGDEPSPKEIADAKSRLGSWAQKWVNKGDEIFAVEQKSARVDFRAKLAARVLQAKRPWSEGMRNTQDTIPCPSCRLPMVNGATKCPACGDRFVYQDGTPVLREEAALLPPQVPSTPPPGRAQSR